MHDIPVDWVYYDVRAQCCVVWDERLQRVSLERDIVVRLADVFIEQLFRYNKYEALAEKWDRNQVKVVIFEADDLSQSVPRHLQSCFMG